jgi:hypothetical protein
MEKYPLDIFRDAVGALAKRWILFLGALAVGMLVGVPLGFARIAIIDAAFDLLPPSVSCILVLFGTITLLMIYLRFEVRHRLLAFVLAAGAFGGYCIGAISRSMG